MIDRESINQFPVHSHFNWFHPGRVSKGHNFTYWLQRKRLCGMPACILYLNLYSISKGVKISHIFFLSDVYLSNSYFFEGVFFLVILSYPSLPHSFDQVLPKVYFFLQMFICPKGIFPKLSFNMFFFLIILSNPSLPHSLDQVSPKDNVYLSKVYFS